MAVNHRVRDELSLHTDQKGSLADVHPLPRRILNVVGRLLVKVSFLLSVGITQFQKILHLERGEITERSAC